MKTVLKIIGGIVVVLVMALVVLRFTGLDPNDPKAVKDRRAGLWLRGTLVTEPVTDWSFTQNYKTIEIQTNTWYLIPHSVRIGSVIYNGKVYLNSRVPKGMAPYPGGKIWNQDVARDPHVRLKIGDNLYDQTLVFVTDPAEFAGAFAAMKKQSPHFDAPPGGSLNIFRVDPNR
jgi:hypothetical protein